MDGRGMGLAPTLMRNTMRPSARTDIYRHGDVAVDVKISDGGWFAVVRVWHGTRWPKVVRTWRVPLKRWLPWFSLQRQAVRAVEYANRRASVRVPREHIEEQVRGALRLF